MTQPSRDAATYAAQEHVPAESRRRTASAAIAQFAAVVVVLGIYLFPSMKAGVEFGAAGLPPIFAPDLSLYLNVSNARAISAGQVLNPYYLVPVPANGTAYLKFRLGAVLFDGWNKLLGGRMWVAMFTWNFFWWTLLCALALWLFNRFLPRGSSWVGITGLGLLMLVNIGMARPLLAAWAHLPALSGFEAVALPFMRAFAPQIPIPLLLGYLGLQMAALSGKSVRPWMGMAVLQLLALSAFPYATLVMAGITAVSVVWQVLSKGLRRTWRTLLVYGLACGVADAAFVMRGSMNIYASHASPIHLQLQLLPHLVGGMWVLVFLLTGAIAFNKALPPEVKWPLVGLGTTSLLLMLGDAVVPSTVLLLSAHATYFAHTTVALLLTFLISVVVIGPRANLVWTRVAFGIVLLVLTLNGVLLSLGTYCAFRPANFQQMEVTRLLSSWQPAGRELIVARSVSVDDACGWVALLSKGPVLYCTDAEIMLTPPQNSEIHRFRQALYLYFTGKGSDYLEQIIRQSNPVGPMYQLGYWAEAISLSREEQEEGIRGIQSDLMPALSRVEQHDPAVRQFLQQFSRIIVVDDLHDPAFVPARLDSYLTLEGEQHLDSWVLRSYVLK